jgi:hypothetical protein
LLLYAAGWTVRTYARFGEQLSALAGMSLGDARGEVKYKLGIPQVVSGTNQAGVDPVRAYYTGAQPADAPKDSADVPKDPQTTLPPGADLDAFRIWSYNNGSMTGPHIDLTFDSAQQRVSQINCIDESDPPTGYCGRLVGISIGEPEGHIVSILGPPTRQYIDEKLGVKTIEYGDIGAAFLLAKQRVYGLAIIGNGARKQPPPARFIYWYANDLKALLKP